MKKLNVIILTIILSLVIFAGVNVMAMDENTVKAEEPKTVISEEAPKGIEGGNTAEEVKAENNEEIVNEEEADKVEPKKESTEVEDEKALNVEEKTEVKTEEKPQEKTSEEKVKEDDSKKSEEEKPEEKKNDNTETKAEDTKKDAEAEVKTEEDKKQDETKDADAKTDEEKAKEGTEEKTEDKAKEGENAEANADAKELKAGETLEVEELAENPIALGAGQGNEAENVVEVSTFDDLKREIENANKGVKKTIVITAKIDITSTIIIPAGADIVLTSADTTEVKPIGEAKIDQPKDSDPVETRQDLVKKAEEKGKKALEDTDLSKNPLPKVDYVLKRYKDANDSSKDFTGTLIKIESGGKLTLGQDKTDPIFIDGNGDNVKTSLRASFIEVNGEFIMNGGFIANGNNESGSSAPIYVGQVGSFEMNGGRITSNKNISYLKKPDNSWLGAMHATGGVYIEEGGTFTMNAGSIDNNTARVGGVFLGNFGSTSGSNKKPAEFIMNGGYIANNKMSTHKGMDSRENQGGGVNVNSNSKFIFINGIIAGNESHHGGGITVNDNYVFDYFYSDNQGSGRTNLSSSEKYEDYIKHAGAYYEQNGGLIFKNKAKVIERKENFSGVGGGIYLNSSTTKFNGGYLLNNEAENMGGGIYVSVAPIVLELDHTLVTKNEAINNGKQYQYDSGNGGGYWNCPIGTVNFEDFNSLYIFENSASKFGQDISALIKANKYYIQRGSNQDYKNFTTYISIFTEKGNVIKYLTRYKKDPGNLYYTNDGVEVTAIYDDKTKEEAWTNSKLFIIGNKALKGAGIGSNANLEAPGKPGDYELVIEKKWDKSVPEYKIPESVVVELYIGDNRYGQIELSKANGWIGKFKKLPFTPQELAKKNLKYSVKEKDDKFYAVVEEEDKTSLEVERIWANTTLSNGYTYDPKPTDVKHSEKIIFIYKDKDGNEIKREDIKISNLEGDGKRWTAFVKNELFAGLENLDNVKITYHDFDTQYNWPGFYGLDEKSDWDGSGPWHEAYIIEKEDGTIEIQLPYIWTQYMGNANGRINEYSKNNSGYRLGVVTNHTFTITNYPYSEIPVSKKWDDSIDKKDIPDQVKVYLLKDGERVKDKNGNDRYVLLNEGNNWKAIFEKLPYFGIKGMEFEKYWVKEDSEIFIPLIIKKENRAMDIDIERVDSDYADYIAEKYWLDNDYTGGAFNVGSIPFEVHYYKDGKVVAKYNQDMTPSQGSDYRYHLKTIIKDIIVQGHYKDSDLIIKTYYDENENPFPRNLGKYKEGAWQEDFIINKGSYVLKVVEENGKLVVYVPKITDKKDDYNLFVVGASIEPKGSFELTNYYLPKHRIEIEKKWQTYNSNSIPNNLKIKIKGKYVDKEITLTPENWKYFEEFLGKGVLSTNNYEFTEEELANFNGSQAIDTTMEFEAKDKTVKFYDADKKEITKDEFLGLIKGKKYSFELKEAVEDKAEVEIKYDADGNMVIVYPVDVVITEVAQVKFTNTEIPPGPPTPRKTFVRVRKVWQALGETRDIQVELYINGEASGKILTLNAANGWSASFTNLDLEDESGRRYTYSVKEVGENDNIYNIDDRKFEVSYSGDIYEGFTIVNKEVPPEEPEEPEEPKPEEPEEPHEPEEEKPEEPDRHVIPKTGVTEDALGIFLGLMILLGLVYIKKKYIVEKSK